MEGIFEKINLFLNYKFEKRWQYITAVFLVAVLLFSSAVATFEIFYYGRIFPRVYAAEKNLSGDIREEASRALKSSVYNFKKQEITFEAPGKTIKLVPLTSEKTEGKLISFDADESLNRAFQIGRNKNIFINFKEQLRVLIWGYDAAPKPEINKILIQEILQNEFRELYKPAVNAQLKIENGEVAGIIPEEPGQTLNYDDAMDELESKLSNFEIVGTIKLNFMEDLPTITKEKAGQFVEPLSEILALAPVVLKYEDKSWEINKDDLASFLELQTKETYEEGVGLNKEKLLALLSIIAAEVDRVPQNAEFEIENDVVKNFVPNLEGLKLDLEKNYNFINQKLADERQKEIELLVEIAEPEIKLVELNTLGINERVGLGITNFAGSPANRRKNIARGAALLQWKLIKPGEEFSLLKALMPFTLENGYLSELVIKGNKTTPEVGGGLCQVGTTMFRVVLDAGLPVTARRNHSYRVSYYEPPIGMDATIYDPAPDFKFINDTGAYLLLATKVEGNELIFELWGSDDGRVASTTDPIVYNFVSPPPEKTIETLDLKPGVKKCTELAHAGSDAKFTYKVIYPSGEIKEEEFTSHYVPWQKVCLLGVEKLSEPVEPPIDENSETPPAEDSEVPADNNSPAETLQ